MFRWASAIPVLSLIVVLAAVALWPAAASAHGAAPPAGLSSLKADVAGNIAAAPSELRAASAPAERNERHRDHSHCGGAGCCVAHSCGAAGAFVLPSIPGCAPPGDSTSIAATSGPASPGHPGDVLTRPPKSSV